MFDGPSSAQEQARQNPTQGQEAQPRPTPPTEQGQQVTEPAATPSTPRLSTAAGGRLASQQYNLAVDHFNGDRFREASAAFAKAAPLSSYLEVGPRANLAFYHALSHFHLKEYEQSRTILKGLSESKEFAESADPNVISLRQQAGFRIGESYYLQNNWAEASKHLSDWLANPEHAKLKEASWATAFLGTALAEQGKKEEALQALSAIPADAPKELLEYSATEKARIISDQGNFRQAIAELEKLETLTEPNRLQLATLYRRAGDFDRASKIISELSTSLVDKSLEASINAETTTISMARAVVLSDSGKHSEAVTMLKPIAQGPESDLQKQAANYLMLAEGRLALASGEAVTAVQKFGELIKLGANSPTYTSALVGLAWSQFRNNSFSDSITSFKAIHAAQGNSPLGKEALQMTTVLEARIAYDTARLAEQTDLPTAQEGYQKLLSMEAELLKTAGDGPVNGALNNLKKIMLLSHISLARHDKEQRPAAIVRAEAALKEGLSAQLTMDTRFELCYFYSEAGDMKQVSSHGAEYEKLVTAQANISAEDFRRLSDVRLMRIRAEIGAGDSRLATSIARQVQTELERLPEVDRKAYRAEAVRLEADAKIKTARSIISGENKPEANALSEAETLVNEVYTHEEVLASIPDAMLTLGDIYTLQGKSEEARNMFDSIRVNYPTSNAAKEATSRIEK